MEKLEARLGYTFRDRRLLENALMHSSYANERRAAGCVSNERLEFLGDSVLGMVTAGRERPSILADAVEAIIAAMYLDGGLEVARTFILERVLAGLDAGVIHHVTDYKTELQEIVQRKADQHLEYVLTGESGPDHNKRFTMAVLLNGVEIGSGTGRSKKEAEQAAAKAALETQ